MSEEQVYNSHAISNEDKFLDVSIEMFQEFACTYRTTPKCFIISPNTFFTISSSQLKDYMTKIDDDWYWINKITRVIVSKKIRDGTFEMY